MTFYNAKIYTMNDTEQIIEKGFVSYENGVITQVGQGDNFKDKKAFDAKGSSIYPGFIDAHTHLGLTCAGVGIEGEDINEEYDPCTPQLRIIDGVNPMDYSFDMARNAGVTSVLISPGSSNPIGGEIYAVKTMGKRIDSMIIDSVGMKFSMGENPKLNYMDKEQTPCTRMTVAAIIREQLYKAKRYLSQINSADSQEDLPEYDIKCQSLIPLLEGRQKAHFHCHRADDIFTAVRIAQEFNLRYVLIHATEGYMITQELAQENACCVVGPVICDRCKPEMANLTPKNAAVLQSGGVCTAICTDHSEVPIEYLPLSVGICIKNGMSFYDGLKAVTCNAAKIAGIYDKTGSLEKGKSADMVIFKENPFDVFSSPQAVIIGGQTAVSKWEEI